MNVNTIVSNLSAPLGRRRVHREGSETIVSKTYNRMRLACSQKCGEVKSKRGPMRFEPWLILTLIASAWAARVIVPLNLKRIKHVCVQPSF